MTKQELENWSRNIHEIEAQIGGRMTKQEQENWSRNIHEIEALAYRLKVQAQVELAWGVGGSHPVVNGLTAIEGLAWGLQDAVRRFPTDEDLPAAPPSDSIRG